MHCALVDKEGVKMCCASDIMNIVREWLARAGSVGGRTALSLGPTKAFPLPQQSWCFVVIVCILVSCYSSLSAHGSILLSRHTFIS